MRNPSPFSVHAGDLAFSLALAGCPAEGAEEVFGSVQLRDASLLPGWNRFNATGELRKRADGSDSPCAITFLSNFVSGIPSNLSMLGIPSAHGVPRNPKP